MSFLDLDEWLIDLAELVEVVYSPVGCDLKEFPPNVDLCLVEGAVANEENLELAYTARKNSKVIVSFGDCAVTANVPAMRNMLKDDGPDAVLRRSYLELDSDSPQLPYEPGIVPELLDKVRPLHEAIPVDLFMPGCPPDAPRIRAVLEAIVRGEQPVMEGRSMLKFG
jgi:NAD-reducing hydrogenase small subunit